MSARTVFLMAALTSLLAAPAVAQPPQPDTPMAASPIKDLVVDLATPDAPAVAALGVSPDEIAKPRTPTEFTTALLNGFDPNGNLKSGVAVEFAPYLLAYGSNKLTIKDYRGSHAAQILSRFQVSFATAKGAGDDDKSLRLGLGFRATLWDRGDPRLDRKLEDCFKDNFHLASESALSVDDLKAKVQAQKEGTLKVAAQCRAEAEQRNWNNSSVTVAFAPTWTSASGSQKDFRRSGQSYWLTAAYGFEGVPGLEDSGQLVFQVRYRNDDPFLQELEPPRPGNSLATGLRLSFGGGDINGAAEVSYVHTTSKMAEIPNDSYYRYSLLVERRVTDGVWLVASFGEESGRAGINSPIYVLTSLKFNVNRKSSIK